MLILTMRTDNPESEIGLYNDEQQLIYEVWPAHRQLAETIHDKLQTMLQEQSKIWSDVQGIVVYKGPGSFTGLRIGLSVVNAIATSYQVPIIGTTGDAWIQDGISALTSGEGTKIALPEYGAPVHITAPRK